jgi:uncharacterized protein YgiM (DUF1202 family)
MVSRSLVIGSIAATVLLGATAADVHAQYTGAVRVATETTTVMSRPAVQSEVLMVVSSESVLDTMDREGDWYWVLLKPDENGTRFTGWVQARDVDVVTSGRFDRAEADKAPVETRPAEDSRQVRKAKRKLERARREYEKLTAGLEPTAVADAPSLAAPDAPVAEP